ncbi:MAG: heavy-metal-associated domain-containing protein, partial [Actinobacteria bacterium]|nr:heavy-metal-associated domain-containing protein [Actinomycetota bacterium]
MQETFKVPDVSCGHCKSAIEGALRPLDGVQTAEVDVDTKTATVDFDDNVIDRNALV